MVKCWALSNYLFCKIAIMQLWCLQILISSFLLCLNMKQGEEEKGLAPPVPLLLLVLLLPSATQLCPLSCFSYVVVGVGVYGVPVEGIVTSGITGLNSYHGISWDFFWLMNLWLCILSVVGYWSIWMLIGHGHTNDFCVLIFKFKYNYSIYNMEVVAEQVLQLQFLCAHSNLHS